MNEFHPGDRVILIDKKADGARDNDFLVYGMTGTVTEESTYTMDPGWVSVEWDEYVQGHDCDGHAQIGYGWRTHESALELTTSAPDIKEDEIMEILLY